MAKGIYTTAASLPRQEPQKGIIPARTAANDNKNCQTLLFALIGAFNYDNRIIRIEPYKQRQHPYQSCTIFFRPTIHH